MNVAKDIRNAINRFISGFGYTAPILMPDNQRAFVDDGYASNADLFAVIDKIITYASKVKIGLMVDGQEVEEHPILDLLSKPNDMFSGENLRELTLIYYLLLGNAYLVPIAPRLGRNAGKVSEIWPLPAQDVELVVSDYRVVGAKANYMYDYLEYDKLIHIKKANPVYDSTAGSWFYGFSPLKAGRQVVSLSNDYAEASQSLVQHGGIKGILSGEKDQNYTESQMKEVKKTWFRRTFGPKNYGKVEFTSAVLRFLDLSGDAQRMGLLENKKFTFSQIANLYGFPTSLLNDKEGSSYNNILELKKEAYDSVVLPLLEKAWVEPLNEKIVRQTDKTARLFCDTSDLEIFQKSRYDKAKLMRESGVFTDNEIRLALDYGESPEPLANSVFLPTGQMKYAVSTELTDEEKALKKSILENL